jgi:hypothetical protein
MNGFLEDFNSMLPEEQLYTLRNLPIELGVRGESGDKSSTYINF